MPGETETIQSQHKEVIHEAFRTLNERDWDRFREIHTPGAVVHAWDTPAIRGIDAIVKDQKERMEQLQIRSLDLHSLIAEGDLAAARWTAEGRMEGQAMRMDLLGMFRFEGDKVAEVWLQGNPAQ